MVGECVDLRMIDARECVRVAREHADLVVGIKVRVGKIASGSNGVAPLDIAIEVAEELGLPVMAHLDFPPPSRREVMERLRPGDVLTHCFRPFPNAPSTPDGAVRDTVAELMLDLSGSAAALKAGQAQSRALVQGWQAGACP